MKGCGIRAQWLLGCQKQQANFPCPHFGIIEAMLGFMVAGVIEKQNLLGGLQHIGFLVKAHYRGFAVRNQVHIAQAKLIGQFKQLLA